MRKLSLLLFFTLLYLVHFSQSTFEGTISYSINYKEVPKEMKGLIDQLPSEMTVTYKDDFKKEEVISSQSSKITITDMKNHTGFVLMSLFDEKIALVHDTETKEEFLLFDKSKVKTTEEEKKIGKFLCKKALIYLPNIKEPITVYFTDKYQTSDPKYKNLGGIPLEFSTVENGMLITYTMKKISKKEVSEKEFKVPENYRILTPEELQKQFGLD